MGIRLNRIIKELNIGLMTAVDFLSKKPELGEVKNELAFKINDAQSDALWKAFGNGKRKDILPKQKQKDTSTVVETFVPIVFISYSRSDLDTIKIIKKEIERVTEEQCWMDLQGIESGVPRFTESIVNGINNCEVFLFMRSAYSQKSEFAMRELNYATKRRKRVVIIHIDESNMSDEFEFMYGLSDTIIWNKKPQRDKLLHDVKKWCSLWRLNEKKKEIKEYEDNLKFLSECSSNSNLLIEDMRCRCEKLRSELILMEEKMEKMGE